MYNVESLKWRPIFVDCQCRYTSLYVQWVISVFHNLLGMLVLGNGYPWNPQKLCHHEYYFMIQKHISFLRDNIQYLWNHLHFMGVNFLWKLLSSFTIQEDHYALELIVCIDNKMRLCFEIPWSCQLMGKGYPQNSQKNWVLMNS